MKIFLFIFISIFLISTDCKSQGEYLSMGYEDIVEILKDSKIDIVERDSVYIHSVDVNTYRNIIFYFTDSICTKTITTFQNSIDFLKLINFYEIKYKSDLPMTWYVTLENGIDSIRAERKKGYDLIEENFIFMFNNNFEE